MHINMFKLVFILSMVFTLSSLHARDIERACVQTEGFDMAKLLDYKPAARAIASKDDYDSLLVLFRDWFTRESTLNLETIQKGLAATLVSQSLCQDRQGQRKTSSVHVLKSANKAIMQSEDAVLVFEDQTVGSFRMVIDVSDVPDGLCITADSFAKMFRNSKVTVNMNQSGTPRGHLWSWKLPTAANRETVLMGMFWGTGSCLYELYYESFEKPTRVSRSVVN